MSGTKFKVKEYTQHTDGSGVVYEYGAEVTKEFPVTFVPSGTLSSTQVYGELRVEDGGTLHADSAVISEVSLGTLKAKTNLLEVTNSHGAGDGGADDTPFIMSLTRPAQASGAIEVKEENTSSGAIAGARIAYQGDGSEDLGVTNPKYSLNVSSLQAINRADGSSTQTAHNVLSFGPTGNAVRLESSDDLDLVATEKVTLQGSKVSGDDTGVLVDATGDCSITATEDISLSGTGSIRLGSSAQNSVTINADQISIGSNPDTSEISLYSTDKIRVTGNIEPGFISGDDTRSQLNIVHPTNANGAVGLSIRKPVNGSSYLELVETNSAGGGYGGRLVYQGDRTGENLGVALDNYVSLQSVDTSTIHNILSYSY